MKYLVFGVSLLLASSVFAQELQLKTTYASDCSYGVETAILINTVEKTFRTGQRSCRSNSSILQNESMGVFTAGKTQFNEDILEMIFEDNSRVRLYVRKNGDTLYRGPGALYFSK